MKILLQSSKSIYLLLKIKNRAKLVSIVLNFSKTPKAELLELIQEITKVITGSLSLRKCFSRYHTQDSRESGQELSVMRQNETNKHSTMRCDKYACYIIFVFITSVFFFKVHMGLSAVWAITQLLEISLWKCHQFVEQAVFFYLKIKQPFRW